MWRCYIHIKWLKKLYIKQISILGTSIGKKGFEQDYIHLISFYQVLKPGSLTVRKIYRYILYHVYMAALTG